MHPQPLEGKTKTIEQGPMPGTVRLVAKDTLTAGDAAKVAVLHKIGTHKTMQAANTFAYLNSESIPTAFLTNDTPDSLVCYDCDMLPIEFVVRRYAWGSYLKRNPAYAGATPHRFDIPVWEMFHKHAVVAAPTAPMTTMMPENEARSRYLSEDGWADGIYTDPYIRMGDDDRWHLYSAKADQATAEPLLNIPAPLTEAELEHIVYTIIMPAFMALESAWERVQTAHGPVRLADIKFEIGRRKSDKQLILADVVDNDSWRIWPGGDPAKGLDKQAFRDGDPLSQVTENYALVTELTKTFV
ncbi:MAG: phosphoribosylaminoimidazolesuccinocarboxamide synthase [Proteobacteria bacterium]|nr:phosphoribosylaminoimidazolesuccinocarboxamide synthase [Pseudomonadota bacterium]